MSLWMQSCIQRPVHSKNCTDQLGQSLVLGLFMKYVLHQFLGDAERLWHVIATVSVGSDEISCMKSTYIVIPAPTPGNLGCCFLAHALALLPGMEAEGIVFSLMPGCGVPEPSSASSALHSQHYALTYFLGVGCCCGNTAFTWISALSFCGEPRHWLSSDYLLSKELKSLSGHDRVRWEQSPLVQWGCIQERLTIDLLDNYPVGVNYLICSIPV